MRRRDATAALVLGLLAAALLSQNADAQLKPDEMSANYMVPRCQRWIAENNNPTFTQGVCVGVIAGLSYVGTSLPPGHSWCSSQQVTFAQMVRVALAYIERRPERTHEDFRRLAIEAWHEAWPCM
jgi:hypothetical protein